MSEISVQNNQYILGSSSTGASLTASYGDNTSGVIPTGGMLGVLVCISYTPKTGQSNRYISLRVERGPTSDDLYTVTKVTDADATDAVLDRWEYDEKFVGAVGGTEYKPSYFYDIKWPYMRFSVKEDGEDNFGIVAVRLLYVGV